MRLPRSGGGWASVAYTFRLARQLGPSRFWRAMKSRNACKTCAFGMGGQAGGMTNEAGHFLEVCKKSVQAMAADMQGGISPELFQNYSIAQLARLSPRELEAFGRLTFPLAVRPGATHHEPIEWADAIEIASNALRAASPQRSFFYASGRSSNEAGFLLQLLARQHGSNHVNNCSYYCHQASGVGLAESIGTGTATLKLEDLEQCDLVFLIGANPASNHPRLMSTLMRLRQRGGQVIVMNPLRERGLQNFRVPSSAKSMIFGSEIARLYLQPKIGGDIAVMAGIAKVLLKTESIDQAFIEKATEDFGAWRSYVESLDWPQIEDSSGVPRKQIERAAELYAASERTVLAWTMGITHHLHGVQNVQWIVNLALLRGMVGKPGAGLLPIRGHSNVQGMGTIGVTPAISKAALHGLESLGLPVPAFSGLDTIGAMEAASNGQMDFGICLGGNLFGATPDASFAARALSCLKTLTYLSTSLNTGHIHGLGQTTLILPVRARDEEAQSTTQESMFSFVRLSDGGPSRFEGPRSEVDVIAEIAEGAFDPQPALNWSELRNHDEIRQLIARLVPNLELLADIGQTKKEFHIPGRAIEEPAFNTPSGRAKFFPHPIPRFEPPAKRQLRLMTIRSEGQFNTVVYEDADTYRGQERRDVILMNPADISSFGLSADQKVQVSTECGAMQVLVRPYDIAQGCAAMYYPEANVLVPIAADPRSKTPAFKSVAVTISA